MRIFRNRHHIHSIIMSSVYHYSVEHRISRNGVLSNERRVHTPEWQQVIIYLIVVVDDEALSLLGECEPFVEIWRRETMIARFIFADGNLEGIAKRGLFGPVGRVALGLIHHQLDWMEA